MLGQFISGKSTQRRRLWRQGFLFLIIFLEGYSVLSAELLAIRQTLPFVGSGTDTVAIIIAAVLLPLAFGYYRGGLIREKIRDKLTGNILKASLILIPGLSYAFLSVFFSLLQGFGVVNRIAATALYATIFLVGPVYLLGQTVPLTSNYLRQSRLSETAGKILLFSTLGSFLGAVFTTLFLMNTIGVNHTVTVTIGCLTILVFICTKRTEWDKRLSALILLFLCYALNSGYVMTKMNIVSNNAYNTVQIEESFGARVMRINRQFASGYYPADKERHWAELYRLIDEKYVETYDRPIPGEFLIIGAAGFTVGMNDHRNNYTYVDIDPDIKEVAEQHFLENPLGKNKRFVASPIRSWLARTDKKFDLIFLDAHSDIIGAPEHLLTREFFQQIKDHMKPESILFMNIIAGAYFENQFSRNLDDTIRSVFPYVSRRVTDVAPPPWVLNEDPSYTNIIYVYRHIDEFSGKIVPNNKTIYTDNLNRSTLDRRDFKPH